MNVVRPSIAAVMLVLTASIAWAQEVRRDGPVQVRIVSEDQSIQTGKPFAIGLLLSSDPGWHVYWRFPGESGLPTTVSWKLPPGFVAGPVQWPVPQRFVSQGAVSFGYADSVLLVSEVTPPSGRNPEAPVVIRAEATWLACRVECVPGKASLDLSLPVRSSAPRQDSRWSSDFSAARSRWPGSVPEGSLRASAAGDIVTLTTPASDWPPGVRLRFYPAAAGMVSLASEPQTVLEGRVLHLRMQRESGAVPPAHLTGLLLSEDSSKAVQVDVPLTGGGQGGVSAAGVASTRAASAVGALLAALALAFIGGLILNLMPCVLPVISLKALSILRHGSGNGVRHGLLFTLGVLATFWVIAGVLEVLRAGGRLVGWGFQFQNPVVVVVSAVLFFLIGLNLFGVFEVGTVLTRLGGRAGGAGGSVASGVFATVVATPCTAPFMGAAVGYALSHSSLSSLGVFSALGLGMAAPSLVLSLIPALARRLPKPGPWMETFRQLMAFPMMGAVVWMVSVLASQTGSEGVVLLLAALLAAGLGGWIWGRWGTLVRPVRTRAVAATLAALLVVGATAATAATLPRSPPLAGRQPPVETASGWEPWSPQRVEELRKAGRPVFVDFSAQWCLTCLVNERVALENPAVRERFREAGVAALRADWTDANEEITRALAGFGRAGVPLYVYYAPGSTEPVVLPEILTPAAVLGVVTGR